MLLVLVLTIIVLYVAWYYWDVRRYPKGPFPVPLFGNFFQIDRTNIHIYMHQMSEKYGPVYTLFMPMPSVIITEYEAIKEALVTKGEHFAGRIDRAPLSLLCKRPNGGLALSVGENYREQRHTAMKILKEFSTGDKLMETYILECVTDLIEQLRAMEEKKEVDMAFPIQLCIGNIINKLLFGYAYPPNDCGRFVDSSEALAEYWKHFDSAGMFIAQKWPWARYLPIIRSTYKVIEDSMKKYFTFIDEEVKKQVDTYDETMPSRTFVHAYLKEMKTTNNPYLSVEQLECDVADLWNGGSGSSIATMRWAILHMLLRPHIQEKVQAEIYEVVGRDRLVTMADKLDLPYTSATLHEIQRFAVISTAVPHLSTAEQTVSGKTIPENTIVFPQFYSVLKHDPLFVDADKFRPERFLNEGGKTFRKELLDRMLQFGIGKRQCPGEVLARSELFLIFANLLHRFSFNASGPLTTKASLGALLVPENYKCRITERP